jgi:hypothetical protein
MFYHYTSNFKTRLQLFFRTISLIINYFNNLLRAFFIQYLITIIYLKL